MAFSIIPIFSQTVGAGGTNAVYFNNIPQTYTHLRILCSVRSTYASAFDSISMYFNGSQANISNTFLRGTGTSTVSDRSTYRAISGLNSASTTSNTFTNIEIYIPNYRSSNFKQIAVDSFTENNSSESYQTLTSELWSQTAAITQLHFDTATSGQPLAQHSTFTLYGIKPS
jgi:hypothetical protein